MNWLHTWTGLILGWLLFAVFLTGTLAFFQYEITDWMQPEIIHPAQTTKAVGQAQAFLSQNANDSERWSITVPSQRESVTTLFWRDPNAGGRGFRRATLDGTGEEVAIRETRGGGFFYRFHFDLHYMPVLWARWLVGIASMCMLVAIVSGVIIHKRIFKDFFTFKPGKGMRSWLDAHTISSVLALPFHFMITYTGLVTLMLMYFTWSITLSQGDRGALFNALNGEPAPTQNAGEPAPVASLQAIFNDATARIDGAPISFISVTNPGDSGAMVELTEAPTQSLVSDYRKLTYSAATGEFISLTPVTFAAEQTRRTMINLHAGRFAGLQLRWLYFISGIVGTLMVATGLVLWLKKRKQTSTLHSGHRLVEVLNFGTLMGLPFAVAAYFAANRLLPLTIAERSDMEIHCFFAAWAFMLVYGLIRSKSRIWLEGAVITACAFFLLPIISVFTVDRHIGTYTIGPDNTLLYMDLAILFTAIGFSVMARYIYRSTLKKEVSLV
ncbi:PepSY domain-containing protein [Alteromonas pelagimontana]|uniref:PepSY domain-containing protein n=2 Tax=Alteromonas pelagimontana TaxID=1858656 RepID=A0A6M4MHW9_9ALTE|nr:PepSY domain-containing protein [Alteromonas pelagimontana]